MKKSRQMAAFAIVMALAGCGSAATGTTSPRTASADHPVPSPSASTGTSVGRPDGWRWESYRGIEVAVPLSWGYGTSGAPWCIHHPHEKPYVGRPGMVALVGCVATASDGTDPGKLIKTGGTFLWFEGIAEPARRAPAKSAPAKSAPVSFEGDRVTEIIGRVRVSVQAPEPLRRKILATVHREGTDQNSCQDRHPISANPAWRPAARPAGGSGAVTSVAACRYALPLSAKPDLAQPGLISSLRLKGEQAAEAVAAISAAPDGGGPDRPRNCTTDYAFGDEVIVLLVQRDTTVSQVVLRYAGCDHHGFDDGSSVRTLTRAAVAPFVTGPNTVNGWSAELGDVLGR